MPENNENKPTQKLGEILNNIYEEMYKIRTSLNDIQTEVSELRKKSSMKDDITRIKNSLFYLPNYPEDYIQRNIVNLNNYWESEKLAIIDNYLKDNSVIVDIGANIGAWAIYWANERHAKKIYTFEPIDTTYEILKRNIEINSLENIITPFNVGLFDKETTAVIDEFASFNIGSTSVAPSKDGKIKLITLDSLNIEEKIDLIKIDVEGAEVEVLKGGLETIKKHKPTITIESFNSRNEIEEILFDIGYELVDVLGIDEEFLYMIK